MSNYHMRRQDRQLNEEDLAVILKAGKFAVISLCKDNQPYIVTLSYGYDEKNDSLYFHCAKEGTKIDYLSANSKVAATVVEDLGYIQNECSHVFRSVVLFGELTVVNEMENMKHGMEVLLNHLEEDPTIVKGNHLKDDSAYAKISMLKLKIEHKTGKAGR